VQNANPMHICPTTLRMCICNYDATTTVYLRYCNSLLCSRVPLEKSRMLPLLPWKDFVPLRSKWVMIFLYYVRPLPASLSKNTQMKINNSFRTIIFIKRFRSDIGRVSDFWSRDRGFESHWGRLTTFFLYPKNLWPSRRQRPHIFLRNHGPFRP